ncbi:hypothetical protein GCM10010278_62960 [Streptomyces melanogenes]|nr:hypothetical protein GCM10010278_62960 [Streptomyces melanogenes]
MRRAGRPQGQLKGGTAEANALAQFVRDITVGRSVRALAQRYRLGKTTWSEYRSAEKIIPWHWLEQLVQDVSEDARVRSQLLAQARQLHTAATRTAVTYEQRATDDTTATRPWLPWHQDSPARLTEQRPAPAGTGPLTPATTDPGQQTRHGTDRLPVLRRRTTTALVRARAGLPEPGREVTPSIAGASMHPTVHIARLEAAADGTSLVRGEVLSVVDTSRSASVALRPEPPRPVPHPQGRARRLALPPGGTATSATRPWRLRAGSVLAVALLLVAVGVLLGVRLSTPATSNWSNAPGTTDSMAPPPQVSAPSVQAPPPLPSPTADTSAPSASPPPASPSAERQSTREADRRESGNVFATPPPESPTSTTGQTVPSAPPGTLYAIAPDHRSIRQWQGHGTAWSRIGGAADRILAGQAGLFAVDSDSKQLLGYLGTPGRWAPVSEPAAEFAMSGNQLYRIAADHSAVHRWDGSGATWTVIGGPASHLYGGGAGLFATHPGDGRIYRYDSGANFWPYVGNAGADFAVTGRHLYGLTPDRSEIFQWNGGASSSWFRVGGPATSLHASPGHVFATTPDHGKLLRYADSPESWAPASEAGADFTITADHIFRLSPDRSAVFQGSTRSPGTWTQIGGPAAAVAASQ